jgi:hypothetical protein
VAAQHDLSLELGQELAPRLNRALVVDVGDVAPLGMVEQRRVDGDVAEDDPSSPSRTAMCPG